MLTCKVNEYISMAKCFRPDAFALITGGGKYPSILGNIWFYALCDGVFVIAEVNGLPPNRAKNCEKPQVGPFGFHIHTGGDCCLSDDGMDYPHVDGHYNPNNLEHPYHLGDMPVLMAQDGYAYLSFVMSSLKLSDIIGRAVIIHESPDDFRSQPSGNSGKMIACGRILKVC